MTVDIIKKKDGDICEIFGKGCVNEGTTECYGCSIFAGIGTVGRINKYKQV